MEIWHETDCFFAGISNGVGMTNRLGCNVADLIAPGPGAYNIWQDCNSSRPVPLLTSQAVNATDVMWDFFKAHPMP